MEREKVKAARELIAYNDLKKWIIDPGFCTLCGACEAACPVHALRIEDEKLLYVQDCSKIMEFCPICYDVCPHTDAFLIEALSFVTDAPYMRESIGYYRKILLAQATDPKLRELSHSGGVVTALLTHSIKKGFIDSAIVSRAEEKAPLKLKAAISLVPDDIFSAVDATYSPSAVAKAFGKAVHEYGKTKIAFVGTPCQVLAIRKLESWEHKIVGSLKLVIGFICLWSFSLKHLLESLEKTHKIKHSEIEKVTLNKEYSVHMKDKTVKVPIKEVEEHVLPSCLTCNDYTSQLADIAVGGAHPLEDWSTVIIRTENGEKIFEDAVKNGVIRVKNIEDEPEVFAHLVEMADFKRKTALETLQKRKTSGKPVPLGPLRLTELLPKELSLLSNLNVEQIMTKDVMTISPETTMEELLGIMTKHHHMGYPILDKNNKLLGIATFEDLMKVPSEKRRKVKVKDVKKEKLITVYPDDTVLTAYEKMTEHGIGRILVVDRENPRKLLGIITKTDIIQTLRWPMKRR
ncbi:Coenzyme F420 hydrogenase/dehydrogenase, beta subunit C-terminal domain [Candidatus Bathyarchaeota archaeon]|nr:Coenzyme F420 hydrogenase/dehydrogenase, beta subunit C-terminal domain [Candidatus Bathyarchaeota archaeon]